MEHAIGCDSGILESVFFRNGVGRSADRVAALHVVACVELVRPATATARASSTMHGRTGLHASTPRSAAALLLLGLFSFVTFQLARGKTPTAIYLGHMRPMSG